LAEDENGSLKYKMKGMERRYKEEVESYKKQKEDAK